MKRRAAVLLTVPVILAASGCGSSAGEANASPTALFSTPSPSPTATLEVPTDPDQLRFYEAVRSAPTWADASAERLDGLGQATCTDLRGYSGAKSLAISSMEVTYMDRLDVEPGVARGAVAAAVARWCPEILD